MQIIIFKYCPEYYQNDYLKVYSGCLILLKEKIKCNINKKNQQNTNHMKRGETSVLFNISRNNTDLLPFQNHGHNSKYGAWVAQQKSIFARSQVQTQMMAQQPPGCGSGVSCCVACQSLWQYPITNIYEPMFAEEDSFSPSEFCCLVTQHTQQFERDRTHWLHMWEACVGLHHPPKRSPFRSSCVIGESWLEGGNWQVTKIGESHFHTAYV